MQTHELKRHTPNASKKIVGRGGKRGKTSGRGHKGQKQHGGTPRPMIRDIIKKIPKLRGYKFSSIQKKPVAVNVAALEEAFAAGETVNPATLLEKGILKGKKSVFANVKILGNGELTKKLTVGQCSVSKAAHDKIVKAGGTVEA